MSSTDVTTETQGAAAAPGTITPAHSDCSVSFGSGIVRAQPGSVERRLPGRVWGD